MNELEEQLMTEMNRLGARRNIVGRALERIQILQQELRAAQDGWAAAQEAWAEERRRLTTLCDMVGSD